MASTYKVVDRRSIAKRQSQVNSLLPGRRFRARPAA